MRLAVLLLIGFTIAMAPAAQAELCSDCTGRSYTKDIGHCTQCEKGMTTSGQFKLCLGCSARLGQCHHCLASLKTVTTQPAATQPIDQENGGHYKVGAWEYRLTITLKGTRSQGSTGELLYQGRPVAEPDGVNDFHQTPWGPMYWVGKRAVLYGPHGWMSARWGNDPGRALPAPPGQRVDISQPGAYTSGPWRYTLVVTSPGSKSEGMVGKLFYNDKPVDEPAVGDFYHTPWGDVQWVGTRATQWGEHGWMPRKGSLVKEGRLLPDPAAAASQP